VRSTVVLGVKTNLGFLATLLDHSVVRAGTADNRFIDRELGSAIPVAAVDRQSVATAAAVLLTQWSALAQKGNVGLWAGNGDLLGWQLGAGELPAPSTPAFSLATPDGRLWPVAVGRTTADGMLIYVDGDAVWVRLRALTACESQVQIDDRIFNVTFVIDESAVLLQGPFGTASLTVVPFLSLDVAAGTRSGLLRAPMMGVIIKVNVKANDAVNAGDVLLVEESMKMELLIEAPCRGTVKSVNCAAGDMVARHQILIDVEPAAET